MGDKSEDANNRATPPCIAFLLNVVRTLLRYGRQLDDSLPAKAEHPRFPTLAAGFGTHDVRRILAHIHRGILRAMMLQKFLLARAAQNRDIEPVQPCPEKPRQPKPQIRRRSVGRTIADICLDLGITPSHCEGETWDKIFQVLTHFGANIEQFFATQQRRKETFQDERDKRPETWTVDWRDRPREALRQILGHLLGETPPAYYSDITT